MDLVDLLTDSVTAGFRGLDVSMLPELRAIRRAGPGRARRAALLAVLHLGGEQALDPADVTVLRRLVAIKLPRDRPHTIDGCFNAWLTVPLGHGGPDHPRTWRHVFISPQFGGWTVVSGPSCDPDQPQVEAWVRQLSAAYGQAQPYFFGSQGDGDAWLVPPERLDTDAEGYWEFVNECGARQVAAELSIDPVWGDWPADLDVSGQALIAWPEADDDVSILQGCYVFHI